MVRPIVGRTSAELRATYLQLNAVPVAKILFRCDPAIQSLVIAVGQFWDDEASDAVHIERVPACSVDPVWPDVMLDRTFYEGEWNEPNPRWYALLGYRALPELPDLNPNGSAITAFAAYCVPGASQDMSVADAFRPYAILRRVAEGEPTVEIVGTMHQSQWERV